jgi:hypothetical protein
MIDQAVWAPVVTAAFNDYLTNKSGGRVTAIPAAPLKPLVARRAAEVGLQFPPEGYENRKFVEFLDSVPSAVSTRRRAGQDVLVAPTDRQDLLDVDVALQTESNRDRSALRGDVFRAFTKIPRAGRQHWYSRAQDAFIELDAAHSDPSLIPVPSETIEGALADRTSFADSLPDDIRRSPLIEALREPSTALGDFTRKVKELRLERAWHMFRLNRLSQKVRTWGAEHQVEWSPSWTDINVSQAPDAAMVSARETNSFLAGLMQLGPEDAKRVLVPLDIVLKLMRRD